MRVTVPDDVAAVLEPHVTANRSVDDLVTLAVRRAGAVPPSARFLLLDAATLDTLQRRLGAIQVSTAAQLLSAVDQLADIKLQSLSFEFTPAQLQELQDRATRAGLDPADLTQRILHAILAQFFTTPPVEAPVLVGPKLGPPGGLSNMAGAGRSK